MNTIQRELQEELKNIKNSGLYKHERIIMSPQDAEIKVNNKTVLNFCANNYLGLSNNPNLIKVAMNSIEKWGLIFIITGAISNIFDRLMNGYVIDFIYLHYKDFYWPAFNFADIYITFGVLMILYQFFNEFKKKITK